MVLVRLDVTVERVDRTDPLVKGLGCDAHGKGEAGPKASFLVSFGEMRYAVALCGRCHSESGLPSPAYAEEST